MLLRPPELDECDMLGEIALAAKSHWGYDRAFLDACRNELMVTPQDLPGIVVAESDQRVLGWHSLLGDPPQGELESLWVHPDVIGRGIGRLLWSDAVRRARARRWTSFRITADPHAEGFYLAMGAERIGTAASQSIIGRHLPLMLFPVTADASSPPGLR